VLELLLDERAHRRQDLGLLVERGAAVVDHFSQGRLVADLEAVGADPAQEERSRLECQGRSVDRRGLDLGLAERGRPVGPRRCRRTYRRSPRPPRRGDDEVGTADAFRLESIAAWAWWRLLTKMRHREYDLYSMALRMLRVSKPMQQPAPVFLEWAELPYSDAALTDGSSIRELAQQFSILSTPLSSEIARKILNYPGHSLFPALSLLERWLVVNTIIVDVLAVASSYPGRRDLIHEAQRELYERRRNALDPLEDSHGALAQILRRKILDDACYPRDGWLTDLRGIATELSVAFTAIPRDVFLRCFDLLSRSSQVMRTARPDIAWGTYGFGDYKHYGEALQTYYGDAGQLARSHLGVERTLVYYEAAAAARIPLALHPERLEEVEMINQAACDAYGIVRDLLRKSVEEPVRKQLESLGLESTVEWPALVAKLVAEAGKQRTSIIEIARELKDSPAAASFRNWLSDLQECLGEGTAGGKVEALRMLQEVQTIASRWAKELDVGLGVRHRRRQLRLAWVPRIGGLLELLETKDLKDPILNRKGYLTFMSSWYER